MHKGQRPHAARAEYTRQVEGKEELLYFHCIFFFFPSIFYISATAHFKFLVSHFFLTFSYFFDFSLPSVATHFKRNEEQSVHVVEAGLLCVPLDVSVSLPNIWD